LKKFERYEVERCKEATLNFDRKTRKYTYIDESEEGLPPFERCIEVPWVKDKISKIVDNGMKLLDFGCNKAQYIKDLKKEYNLTTYGIDMKPQGSNFVDVFFKGQYGDKIEKDMIDQGPYDIITAISAVEHAGHTWHPDISKITDYQKRICQTMIDNSSYFFLSVPFGKRPGWAADNSRKNLYQFDQKLISDIVSYANSKGCDSMVEVYKFDNGYWIESNLEESSDSVYRNGKQGASSIVLLSVSKK